MVSGLSIGIRLAQALSYLHRLSLAGCRVRLGLGQAAAPCWFAQSKGPI